MSRSRALCLFGLAIALTVAALLKPVMWDDEAYFQFAHHIVEHPFDPYGAPLWHQGFSPPALYVLAPPLLLYWWAGALALFNGNVALTPLALLPFAAAYVVAFHSLARRFAPPLALHLTVIATIAPWALVTISYMLDFPAVALGLAALALFITGAERGARGYVVAAGMAAGLALETKYNAAAAVGAILLWSLFARRAFDGLLAAGIAALVFCFVETLIAVKYGHSHFVIHVFSANPVSDGLIGEISRLRALFYASIENSGPLAMGALLLLPLALGDRREIIWANAAFAVAAFALSAIGLDCLLGYVLPGTTPDRMPMVLTTSGLLGLTLLFHLARLTGGRSHRRILADDRAACFLVAWGVVETAVYFAISPFPGARRIGEMMVPLLLLAGRLVALRAPGADNRVVRFAIAFNAICGLTMLAIVVVDAWNFDATAQAAAAFMRENRQGGETWQAPSLSFIHRLDIEGIRRIERTVTTLRPGDLFVTDDHDLPTYEAIGLQPIATIRAGVNLGVSVLMKFFTSANPWFAAPDTRPEVIVFRASKTTVIPPELR